MNIGQLTVLVGPNNEGKSNLLNALVVAMEVLTSGRLLRSGRIARFYASSSASYKWKRDFPMQLQSSNPDGESVFELEFLLDEQEVGQFKMETGSSLNHTLPIRVAVGQLASKVTVRKKGRGGKALSAKQVRIAQFVSSRLE